MKISTTGIYRIFRGFKFEPDVEIGQKVPFCKGLAVKPSKWGLAITRTCLRVIFYPHPEVGEMEKLDVPVNVSVNVPVNDRQKWFLKQIGKNISVSSSDIATHWGVSQKTAKRDIADLKQKELIEFLGAPKNGYYRLRSRRLK